MWESWLNRAKCKINFDLFSFPRCSLSWPRVKDSVNRAKYKIKIHIFYFRDYPCLPVNNCQNPAFPTLDADSQSITTRFPTLHSVGNPALLPKTTRKPYTWKSLRRSSPDPCIATQLQYQKSYHTLVRSVPCFGTHRTTAWYYGYHCSLTVLVDYLESYSR